MNPAAPATHLAIEENWVSCDRCMKWRLLPLYTKPYQLPENWLCSMLFWVPGMNRCEIPEEETTDVMRSLYQMLFYEGQSNGHNHGTGTATGMSSFGTGSCVKYDSNAGSIAENKLVLEMVPSAAAAPLVIEESWVSCDHCLKWRLLPLDTKPYQLPVNWFCSMLFWVPGMNRCDIPEEETTSVMRALYQMLISEGRSNMHNHDTGTETGVSFLGGGLCVKDDSNAGSIAGNKYALEIFPAAATSPLVIKENWVSCDRCLKWRLLPLDTKPDQLPENWLCSMLFWVPGMNRCDVPEEETTSVMRALYPMSISECQSYIDNHVTGTATGVSSVDAGPFVQEDSNSGTIAENKLALDIVPAAASPSVIEENWVSCDRCLKWRLLPLDTKLDQLPVNWLCRMLFWVPGMNRCEIPEEETTNVMRSFY